MKPLSLQILDGEILELIGYLKLHLKEASNISVFQQEIETAIRHSILFEKWEKALLLTIISPEISPDITKLLSKHKDKIINPEFLGRPYITTECLQDALLKKNNLGILAYEKRGFFDPRPSKSYCLGMFNYSPGALGNIKMELENRKRTKSIRKDKDCFQKLSTLYRLDTYIQSTESEAHAKKFEKELSLFRKKTGATEAYQWFSTLIETLYILSNQGYLDSQSIKGHTRVIFNSKEAKNLGKYKGDNYLHIGKKAAARPDEDFSLLSTVLHELTHHLCKLIYGSYHPEPKKEWEDLSHLIKQNISDYKRSHSNKLPQSCQILDCFSYYDKPVPELPPRLVQFFLTNGPFLEGKKHAVFSKETISNIKILFNTFLKDVRQFKHELEYFHEKNNSPEKIALFQYLQEGNLKELTKYVTPKTYHSYDLYPLHFCCATSNTDLSRKLEQEKFSIVSTDSHGRLPIEIVIERFDPNMASYLLRGMKKIQIAQAAEKEHILTTCRLG